MNITVLHEQAARPITVFRVEGRINLGNADELRQKARVEYENGMRDLLIDLTAVASMTTEGLRVLQYIYMLLEGDAVASGEATPGVHVSRHLKLFNPSPHLRHVLDTAGFVDFIEVHDNWQAAVASF
jgi:anti-anti-sigma factor